MAVHRDEAVPAAWPCGFISVRVRATAFASRADLLEQALLHVGGRLSGRRCQSKHGDASTGVGKLLGAPEAKGQVRFHRLFFGTFERAEGVEIEIFVASWMAVHVSFADRAA